MKVAVLVPSHIYYSDQLKRLANCLESLSSQTVVPKIFVSISFENDSYKDDFKNILRKYATTVHFKISAEQKFQMEHLLILSQYVSDYDMIMFCDDDDTYLPMRVEKFIEAFEECKRYCDERGINFGGIREFEDKKKVDEGPEYWAYGIPPLLLKEFFDRIKGYEDLMRYKFGDMYLRSYLKRTGGESILFGCYTPDPSELKMYQYTTDNPNSICARNASEKQTIKNANSKIKDNITLALIYDNIDLVKEYMKDASVPMSMLKKVVPNVERIKKLTKILYI